MKEIKLVDKERGIVRVTTTDERWYAIGSSDPKTGLPSHAYYPSATWISSCYPKDIAFMKWLADQGWDNADKIKNEAGGRGSKIHAACEILMHGNPLSWDEKIKNPKTELMEDITTSEWGAICSFKRWFDETQPNIHLVEHVILSHKYGYAGTIDLVYEKDGQIVLLDIKTGKNVYTEYELQLSCYKHALIESGAFDRIDRMEILQVGYNRNKAGFKVTEIEDKFDLFLAARQIWANENGDEKPKQKDYPLSISISPQWIAKQDQKECA